MFGQTGFELVDAGLIQMVTISLLSISDITHEPPILVQGVKPDRLWSPLVCFGWYGPLLDVFFPNSALNSWVGMMFGYLRDLERSDITVGMAFI